MLGSCVYATAAVVVGSKWFATCMAVGIANAKWIGGGSALGAAGKELKAQGIPTCGCFAEAPPSMC